MEAWSMPDEEQFRRLTPSNLIAAIIDLGLDAGSIKFLKKYWTELCSIRQQEKLQNLKVPQARVVSGLLPETKKDMSSSQPGSPLQQASMRRRWKPLHTEKGSCLLRNGPGNGSS